MLTMRLDEFDFSLPEELIAQDPSAQRGGSRLLTLEGRSGALEDRLFAELPTLLQPGDLLVFNDTRVLKARLLGHKDSGGAVEMLIERPLGGGEVLAQLRASHAPRPGSRLHFPGGLEALVGERQGSFHRLRLLDERPLPDILDAYGQLPLPPYVRRLPGAQDDERYQTVYAREPGAVAAPTAGLHFDEAMFARLGEAGVDCAWVTLHVGAGTFQPVRVEDISEHRMHSEWYRIPQDTVEAVARTRQRGGRVVAVGTTSLRALESAASGGPLTAGEGETDIFITPGFRFQVVDRLLTNFHLPRSTLLMLVAAFAGLAEVLGAYAHAVRERYRFYSFGDAMLIDPQRPPEGSRAF